MAGTTGLESAASAHEMMGHYGIASTMRYLRPQEHAHTRAKINELHALKGETRFVLFCRVVGCNTEAGNQPVRSLAMHS